VLRRVSKVGEEIGEKPKPYVIGSWGIVCIRDRKIPGKGGKPFEDTSFGLAPRSCRSGEQQTRVGKLL